MTDPLKDLLTRAVAELVDPEGRFQKKLATEPENVVIKLGIDPTRPDLHLGHAVCLWKLRAMQELGAKVVLIIGDFTGRIGDPTGKSKVRPELDQKEIEENLQTYLEQAGKILIVDDPQRFVWIRNSDWFVNVTDVHADQPVTLSIEQPGEKTDITLPANSVLAKTAMWEQTRMQPRFTQGRVETISLINFLATLRKLTHSRLVERDMFQARIKGGEALYMHEMMYPVLQGLDSLMIYKTFGACDLELGGTDQHFNNLMGREVMDMHGVPPQAVMTVEIIEGTDGKEKMSKSLDNYIGISESPTEMFGKTMRIPDELIVRWATLATTLDAGEFETRLKNGENPRSVKADLAKAIIARYHSPEAADRAAEEFSRIFAGGGGGTPDDVTEVSIEMGNWNIVELLTHAKLASTKSEARRLIEQGGVRANGQTITSHETIFDFQGGELLLQVGKRRFAKIMAA